MFIYIFVYFSFRMDLAHQPYQIENVSQLFSALTLLQRYITQPSETVPKVPMDTNCHYTRNSRGVHFGEFFKKNHKLSLLRMSFCSNQIK